MANEKIKKSAATLAGVTASILIAIFFFTAFYYWIDENATESGVTIDQKYNDSFTSLQTERDSLSNTIDSLRNATEALTEPGEGFGVAWNGLKGLVNVFKIPFQLVNIAWQSYQLMFTPLEGLIPGWLLVVIQIGILAYILYIIVSIFKGDSNVIR